MDDYSSKRSVGGLVFPRKGSSLSFRDTEDNGDQAAQFCSRLGCNGRLSHVKGNPNGCDEKSKSSRSSLRSSGKEIVESSSKTYSVVTSGRKSFQETRKTLSSQLETDISDTDGAQHEPEVQDLVSSKKVVQMGFQSQLEDTESGKSALMEVGSSGIASKTRPRKILRQKSVMANQDASMSLSSQTVSQGSRSSVNANRYGLRSLRCNSISDVIPQGCSSAESDPYGKRDIVKKRNPEGESSSSVRGKKMSGTSSEDRRLSLPTGGISISGSRRARNWPSSRDSGIASVRTRQSMNGNPGGGLSNQFSTEASSSRVSTFVRPGSIGDDLSPISPTASELGITRLMNRNAIRRYNMDGIAEVLLALERIEQDEELTYEQLLTLETNLFLDGLNLYDHHRDMRLDIDNMSYEELLALEEKMGTVSTALSEEEISKCLRRSIYRSTLSEEGVIRCSGDGDDIKCSICQEEYVGGDEIGKLGCEHWYHVVCINRWLQLKNWCPICKLPAAPSPTSSPGVV